MTAATAHSIAGVTAGDEQSFPYDNPAVGVAYHSLALELANAISAIGTPFFKARVTDYLAARRTFKGLLKARDYGYFAAQCAQAGGPAAAIGLVLHRLSHTSLRIGRRSSFSVLAAGEAVLAEHGVSFFKL
jgi:hypothetical protein